MVFAALDRWEIHTNTPHSKYTKYTVVFDLEANTQIHQGGVFSPPSSKYSKYTVYLGSGGVEEIH